MDMKEWIGTVEKKLEEFGVSVSEVKSLSGEFKARADAIEQKATRAMLFGGQDRGEASLGKQFIDAKSAELAAVGTSRFRTQFDIKSTITAAVGSGGDLVVPTRDIATTLPKRRFTVRNLLTTLNVSTGTVEYPRQTSRPSAAAMVAEGALKPESAMALTLASVPMRVIAHWIPASRQILDDAPQLMGMIDSELLYGLMLKEESQLLYGDGTGENLTGLVPAATAYAAPITIPSPTLIDQIGLSILQQSLTDFPADGVVIHPSDWWKMRLLKDTQGHYILGDPGSAGSPVLFGLPVVATQAMTATKFLTGGFSLQTLYDRWQARVEVSTEHADFFTRNLVAILAEERIGLGVKQPQALVYGTFS